jgi:hypothetical protein
VQRDVPAADRSRARAAVGLEHVTVHRDLELGDHPEVGDRAQRPPDEALDLLSASGLATARRFPIRTLESRTGKHRVLGRHPTASGAPQPRRDTIFERRGAQDAGAAEVDEHRAHRELGEVAHEQHRPQLVGLTPVLPNPHSGCSLATRA